MTILQNVDLVAASVPLLFGLDIIEKYLPTVNNVRNVLEGHSADSEIQNNAHSEWSEN